MYKEVNAFNRNNLKSALLDVIADITNGLLLEDVDLEYTDKNKLIEPSHNHRCCCIIQ